MNRLKFQPNKSTVQYIHDFCAGGINNALKPHSRLVLRYQKDAGDWHLNYYLDNDDMRTPQGSLCCTGLKIEEDAGLSGKLYCFAITPTQGACQRRRVCACDTEEQRKLW